MPADSALERPLPSNLDAERSILGAILLDNNALNTAIEALKAEDFFLSQHQRVFQQMIALGEAQHAIDLVTLTEELHRHGELDAAGGSPYLASLVDGVARVSNVEHYARIVKEKAMLRNLIHATDRIKQSAFEGEDGADAILDGAESSIFALAEDRVKAGLLPIKDIVHESFDRLERIFREGKSITGISTGYGELDKLLSGLQPSELLILAASPLAGQNGFGPELCRKHCHPWRPAGGGVQSGNVQGIAATAAGGFGSSGRCAQIPFRPSQPRGLEAHDRSTRHYLLFASLG